MNKINKKEHLLKLVLGVLDEIRIEIEKAKQGLEAIDGLQQLQYIELSLERVKSMFNLDSCDVMKMPKLSIARLAIDTWPLNNDLREKICQIEYEYNRMKN